MELETIRDVRKMRGLTVSELSRLSGISRYTLSGIEKGIVNPSYRTVLAIVRALDSQLVCVLRSKEGGQLWTV